MLQLKWQPVRKVVGLGMLVLGIPLCAVSMIMALFGMLYHKSSTSNSALDLEKNEIALCIPTLARFLLEQGWDLLKN